MENYRGQINLPTYCYQQGRNKSWYRFLNGEPQYLSDEFPAVNNAYKIEGLHSADMRIGRCNVRTWIDRYGHIMVRIISVEG